MVPLLCNLGSRPNYVSTRTFLRWDRLLHPHDFGIPPAASNCQASSPCQPCQPRTSWSRAKLVQRLNVQVKTKLISIYSYQTFLLLHFISPFTSLIYNFHFFCKYTFFSFYQDSAYYFFFVGVKNVLTRLTFWRLVILMQFMVYRKDF